MAEKKNVLQMAIRQTFRRFTVMKECLWRVICLPWDLARDVAEAVEQMEAILLKDEWLQITSQCMDRLGAEAVLAIAQLAQGSSSELERVSNRVLGRRKTRRHYRNMFSRCHINLVVHSRRTLMTVEMPSNVSATFQGWDIRDTNGNVVITLYKDHGMTEAMVAAIAKTYLTKSMSLNFTNSIVDFLERAKLLKDEIEKFWSAATDHYHDMSADDQGEDEIGEMVGHLDNARDNAESTADDLQEALDKAKEAAGDGE